MLSVVQQGLTKGEAARKFGVTSRCVHTLVSRYVEEGLDALEKSRRPKSNPRQTPLTAVRQILELGRELTQQGLDAGASSIRFYLLAEKKRVPAESTISRLLRREGLVIPEAKKRPKSSFICFEANQANEIWQSDFTH